MFFLPHESRLQFGFKKWLILPIKTEIDHFTMKAGVRDVLETASD